MSTEMSTEMSRDECVLHYIYVELFADTRLSKAVQLFAHMSCSEEISRLPRVEVKELMDLSVLT